MVLLINQIIKNNNNNFERVNYFTNFLYFTSFYIAIGISQKYKTKKQKNIFYSRKNPCREINIIFINHHEFIKYE